MANSRYTDTSLALYLGKSRTFELGLAFRSPKVNVEVNPVQYRVREGETFQSIAIKFYNDPELWYYIADSNPNILYSYDLYNHVGELINIPSTRYVLLTS
tara:strand:+ start:2368 stop:2667 length:300 start_codon:yes stop_codon:yes gene_type:complete